MDPLKEIGRKQQAMDKGAYQDALNRPIEAIQQSTPYRLADLIMNGEDADISMAESLIPTLSLQKKLKQGKVPGLADILDIPNPLSAMAPIGYAMKELRAGARLGKTLRNIEKAKEARDYVTRFHRTPAVNEADIDREGLRIINKNRGRNTGDIDDYIPVNFLGLSPTNIPVIRRLESNPDAITTYKVNIPKSEYWNTPRVKFEGGRGGKAKIVPSGKPSISNEGDYLIDTFGKDIPPEWLQKISSEEFRKKMDRVNRDRDIRAFTVYGPEDEGNEIIGNAVSRLDRSNPSLYKRHLGDVGMLKYNGDLPSWDLEGLDDALEFDDVKPHYDSEGLRSFKDYFTTAERLKSNQKLLDNAIYDAQKFITRFSEPGNSIGPYFILKKQLKSLPDNLKTYYAPGSIPGFSQPKTTVPMPKSNAFGSISAGNDDGARRTAFHYKLKDYLNLPKDSPERPERLRVLKNWMDAVVNGKDVEGVPVRSTVK